MAAGDLGGSPRRRGRTPRRAPRRRVRAGLAGACRRLRRKVREPPARGADPAPIGLRRSTSGPTWPRTSSATSGRTRSSSAATSPTRPTPSASRRSRTRPRAAWYVRQLVGAANIDGGPLFHVDQRQPRLPGRAPPLSGHAEHPLRRDRAQGARHLRALRAALQHGPVRAGSGASVQRTILRLAFPGGKPRPKPGPYTAEGRSRITDHGITRSLLTTHERAAARDPAPS